MLKGKKILITGGGGFIGSNLVEELMMSNEVTVLDNFSTGRKSNLVNLEALLIEGSIIDYNLVKDAAKGMDFIFHLAALPSVPRSVADPLTSNNVNVNGTLNVLYAAKENNVSKVVFSSSSSVYGDTPVLPKVETMPQSPQSPYAVTKSTGEHYCSVFHKVYGLATTSVRYFNVYGPRQNPDSEYAAVIPKFIDLLVKGQQPVIYGDGEQTRDFTFVKDAVRATISACVSSKADGRVMNVAGGRRISLNQLAERLATLTGNADVKPIYEPPRKGDIKHSLADIGLLAELTGFKPEFDIDAGLEKTVKWYAHEGRQ